MITFHLKFKREGDKVQEFSGVTKLEAQCLLNDGLYFCPENSGYVVEVYKHETSEDDGSTY